MIPLRDSFFYTEYKDLDLAVFALNGKYPYKSSHGHLDAVSDRAGFDAQCMLRPNATGGVALPKHVAVIDVDIKPTKGKHGDKSIAEYELKYGPLPETPESRTDSGGRHLWFKTSTPVQCRNGFIPSVDCKTFGGYVVAYGFLPGKSPDDLPLAELPAPLVEMINGKAGSLTREKFVMPEKVQDGARNDTLIRLGGQLRANKGTYGEILAHLRATNEERCDPPLEDSEVETIAKSASGYAPGKSPKFQAVLEWPHKNLKDNPLKHWENTKALCDHSNIHFRFNELSKEVEIDHPRFAELSGDSVITELRGIGEEVGYSLSKNDAADHIARIAEAAKYHPVRDYLNKCMKDWDGKSRIRDFFGIFKLAPGQDEEFLYILFEKWLITCVKMAFNDGNDAAQGVLVLYGPQGLGKTRFIHRLLPKSEWGKTGVMLNWRDKDTLIQALGYWLVELGEYGRNLTAEKNDNYKAFITMERDIIRMPYGRNQEKRPRSTAFYATTDTDEFLKDAAGERRNWVLALDGFNDVEVDISQMWGEVAHKTLVDKAPHWLTSDEIKQTNAQNERYKIRSGEYEIIHNALDWDAGWEKWIQLTASEVCRVVGIHSSRIAIVGKVLRQMAHLGVLPSNNTGYKKYRMPPFKDASLMGIMRTFAKDWNCQSG